MNLFDLIKFFIELNNLYKKKYLITGNVLFSMMSICYGVYTMYVFLFKKYFIIYHRGKCLIEKRICCILDKLDNRNIRYNIIITAIIL